MRLNGKELTEQQIEQLRKDYELDGAAIVAKYKTNQDGEHPILTRKEREAMYERMKKMNPNQLQRSYHEWVWMRLAFTYHAPAHT